MSPFEIFRRNLKPMMVFLTALALFAFVVLPAMDSYLRRGSSGGSDPQIAVFDGTPVTQSRVDYLTRNHHSTVNFLRELATETIRRGGAPRTPGFVYDTESQQIRQLGIDERPSPLSTVRTLQFATEASKSGFQLDDTAIKLWLDRFTDGTMSDSEVISLLMASSRNQMGQYHLYEQLRNQLLAELYQRASLAGVVDGQFPIMTPAEQWANFLKINQKATVNTYGVLVNDYIDQTNKSPAETEIQAVYKEGIDRYPSDESATPGFRKRDTAKFEYLVADMKKFTDREIAKISEETLRAEYERRLKGGDFQLPDTPELNEAEAAEGPDAAANPETSATSEPGSPEPQTAEQESADDKDMKKPAVAEETDADPAADTEPADDDPKPADEEDESAKNLEQVESFKQELDAVRQEEQTPPPAEEDQSSLNRANAVRLVAFQQDGDDKEVVEVNTDEPAETPAKTESDEPTTADDQEEQPKTETEPAENTGQEPAETEPAEKADDKKADDKKADDKKADDKKADDKKADDKKADGEKANGETAKPAEKAAPKIESFEDVRDQIAQSLAAPIASKKRDSAVTEVMTVMRRYFNKKAIYDSNVLIEKAGDPPVKPNLKALAKKLGLEYESVGPHDIATLDVEPISKSSEASTQLGGRGPSFAAMMFGIESDQSFIPKQQLYSPLRTSDEMSGRTYVSWKTEEKEGYVPELDEVRAEVVMAIRKQEARELARAAAEKIAKQVNAGKTLAEVVAEDKKANLKEGLGPFSWMQSFGFQGAFLGNVPELDSVGEKFMAAVFKTEIGKAGVAANIPERVIYVIQATDIQPHVDDLKQIFKQPQERMMALPLGSNEVRSLLQGFYKAVDERTGFTMAADE